MPIYEYLCPDGHRFEVVQRFSDEPVTVCEVCGKPVQRVLFAPAVHYKGKGFYATDYGRKGANGAKPDSGGGVGVRLEGRRGGVVRAAARLGLEVGVQELRSSKSSDSKSSGGEGSSSSKKSDSSKPAA